MIDPGEKIEYVEGGDEILDLVAPMWAELTTITGVFQSIFPMRLPTDVRCQERGID